MGFNGRETKSSCWQDLILNVHFSERAGSLYARTSRWLWRKLRVEAKRTAQLHSQRWESEAEWWEAWKHGQGAIHSIFGLNGRMTLLGESKASISARFNYRPSLFSWLSSWEERSMRQKVSLAQILRESVKLIVCEWLSLNCGSPHAHCACALFVSLSRDAQE